MTLSGFWLGFVFGFMAAGAVPFLLFCYAVGLEVVRRRRTRKPSPRGYACNECKGGSR